MTTSIVYVGDPMCSWCYGFAPSLAALRACYPDVPLRLVVGGLRAGGRQTMADLRAFLRSHWRTVARTSGQPFDESLLARDDFVYDTEPACRAVVAARRLNPALAWPMFSALQSAFYAQGKPITSPEVATGAFATVAAAHCWPSTAERDFANLLGDPVSMATTADDFALARRWGVAGFPTLLLVDQDDAAPLTLAAGYMAPNDLLPRARALGLSA